LPVKQGEGVRFTPITQARLVADLAAWIDGLGTTPSVGSGRNPVVVGFDGAAEIGATELADHVAEALTAYGRPVLRASTCWWWRPAALRLELGRQDVDMLLTGWVDAAALKRELIAPVVAGNSPYITRLRDPSTDRSVRQTAERAQPGSILLIDAPFLLAAGLPLDAVVGLSVNLATLRRALAPDRSWWIEAFRRYQADYEPSARADVLLSYDHPSAPAVAGPMARPQTGVCRLERGLRRRGQ
jgi:hypothetical protein